MLQRQEQKSRRAEDHEEMGWVRANAFAVAIVSLYAVGCVNTLLSLFFLLFLLLQQILYFLNSKSIWGPVMSYPSSLPSKHNEVFDHEREATIRIHSSTIKRNDQRLRDRG
jgi:hypothetical protein